MRSSFLLVRATWVLSMVLAYPAAHAEDPGEKPESVVGVPVPGPPADAEGTADDQKKEDQRAAGGDSPGTDPESLRSREAEIGTLKESEVIANKLDTESLWSHFSAGILVNVFFGSPIGEAEVRDGVVRVKKERTVTAGIGVQAYFPFWLARYARTNDGGKTWTKYSEHGFGPYVGVSFGSDDVIDTVALGLAYSGRREDGGIKIGVGVVVDPNAKFLASDYKEDEPAPAQSEDINFKEKMAFGLQLMVSFTPGLPRD